MLVLTRRQDESITIGSDVVVTVVRIDGNQVRLGISAPRELEIHRPETEVAARKRRGGLEPTDGETQ